MRLRLFGLGDDMMSPAARWSWKSLIFPTIMYCSAQEYGTSSTTNNEGDHGDKQDGGCQNNTTLSVDYSREGPKAVLEFGPAMSASGNTRLREHDVHPNPRVSPPVFARSRKNARIRSNCARKTIKTDCDNPSVASLDIWVCNVPFWEHQSSAL